MTQPPFDFGLQAMADFWGQAGKAAAQAQSAATQSFAGFMGGMPGLSGSGAPSAQELAEPSKTVADLWTAATAMFGGLSSMMDVAGKGADPTIQATLRAIADPRAWFASAGGMDAALARVGEGPQFADLWTSERAQARVMKIWLDVQRRTLEHNAVVLDAWMRASRAFTEAAMVQAHNDGHALGGRAMLALWTTHANATLLEAQRSEKFLQTQAAMIRAGAELKLAQRELAERFAVQFDMPTRTEMDDVHRTVTELRRELRALQRELHAETAKRGPEWRSNPSPPTSKKRRG